MVVNPAVKVVKVVSVGRTTIFRDKTKLHCTPSVVLTKPTWPGGQDTILGLSACIEREHPLPKTVVSTNTKDDAESISMLNEAEVWAPSSENHIVQCYRAILLMAKCPELHDDTACACYYVMDTTDNDIATRNAYMNRLRENGLNNIESIRDEIIQEKVPDNVIDQTIGALINSGSQPDKEELIIELEEGRINRTNQVNAVLSS